MSARAHPRAVGAFVLAAVALLLAAVVLLSAGDWLAPKDRFVVFFPGSVRGLNPGAPVTFRGVKTGEVKDVTAFLTGKVGEPIQIEVVIELRRNVVELPEGVATPWRQVRGAELGRQLIAAGIRGRLLSQSLLTGQKYIEFEFLPAEQARFSGIPRRYPELPTAASAMEKMSVKFEQILDDLAELPVDRMLADISKALQSLRQLLEAPELRAAIRHVDAAAAALPPALEETRQAASDARSLAATLGSEAKDAGGELRRTLEEARRTLAEADRTLVRLELTASGADDTRVEAARTLQELSRTLAATRSLVDYLQAHPEALLQGKPGGKEKK